MRHLVVNGEPLMNDRLVQKRQIKHATILVIMMVLSITLVEMVEVVEITRTKKLF